MEGTVGFWIMVDCTESMVLVDGQVRTLSARAMFWGYGETAENSWGVWTTWCWILDYVKWKDWK